MSTLTSFESLLKEVVTAKRLSASKMNKLTDIALNLMENDTQLISTLYRMHKTLAPSSKINSLYAFDALSRAARSKVNKLGLSGDINAERGNCATFLLKIDGILDALIQDMMSIGTSEAKAVLTILRTIRRLARLLQEKTRKILDIWTKNSTFPASVLTRLEELAKDSPQKVRSARNETEILRFIPVSDTVTTSSAPPTDPRAAAHAGSTPVHITPPQPPVATDPAQAQALLQALLGSVAPTSVGDVIPANGSTVNQTGTNLGGTLQANQIVLLQQLVERAKTGSNNEAALPVQDVSIFPGALAPATTSLSGSLAQAHPQDPLPSTSHNSPPQNSYGSGSHVDHYGNSKGDQRHSRWDEPHGPRSPRNRENEDWNERDPPGWRGGFRGGSRGSYSGRGGRQGWRDYDDRDGPPRRRRSRSRSPPRFGRGRGGGSRGGRDIRPYSPPRRPSLAPLVTKDEVEKVARPTPPGASQIGKDEFGRDIRPSSPDTPTTLNPATTPSDPSAPQRPSDSRQPSSFAPTHVPSHSTPSSPESGGLETIDFSTFDFSSPLAWETLGKAWRVTHGSFPSQEQLMHLVMGGMSQANAENAVDQGPSSHSSAGWQNSQNHQPGKSIPTYESGSNLNSNSWQGKGASWQGNRDGFDYEHGTAPIGADTDAVVLGGGETQSTGGQGVSSGPEDSFSTGGMKRVGDRWVWQPS